MTSLSKTELKDNANTQQNIMSIDLSDQLKELYSASSYIPALIEDMEGMREHSMKDYYVKLKTVIQEEDFDEKSYVGFDKVGGQKINIDIEDLFDKIKGLGSASKILIVGGAGVGKSTLMQYMAYKWSQDSLWEKKFDFVYRVTLKTLLNNSWKQLYYQNKIYSSELDKKPLKYIIHHNLQRMGDSDQIKQVKPEDILFTQNSLLLLDGYDEITHLQDDITYQALQSEIFEQSFIILTSRPNAVDKYFKAKFNRIIENIGLDNEGMDQFINLQFQEENKENKIQKQEAQKLLSNSQIRSICQIPVNLAMLCYLCSQKSGSQKEVKVFNSCQLYQQVILKLGERFISKDFRGALHEGQSLQEKIQLKLANLPEIKVLRHIAYMGLTGGGVENQNQKKQQMLIIKTYSGSKDNWGLSIQSSIKALNVEVNVDRLIKFGLLKQEGNNPKNKEYCFIHLSFQEYLTAEYLIEKITSGTEVEYKNVIKYISTYRNEPKLLYTLKFMCGILTQSYNIEALKDFWNSMSCNVEGLLEFSIEGKIKLLTNMLGQAYRKDQQNQLVLDDRIPNFQQIVDIIHMVIITDIKQFKELLRDSHYVSEQIQNVIEGFLIGEDRRQEIVQQIYDSYFPPDKQQEQSSTSIKENKDSSIKQVIDYIFKQFQMEQQSNSKEQFDSHIPLNSKSSLNIKKTQLIQFGLDIALYVPQKIQTQYLEDSIIHLLEVKGDWQIQRFALFSYGQIVQAIKLDNSLFHKKILNFILEIKLENKNSNAQILESSAEQNLLDSVFDIINHVIELDAPSIYNWIADIFNYCFYSQQDTLQVLVESIKQNIQSTKTRNKTDADKLVILSAEFAEKAMDQIFKSDKFINEKQKFISIFNIIPLILCLFPNEKQREIFLGKSIHLFYELLSEDTLNNKLIQIIDSIINVQTNSEDKKKLNENSLQLFCKFLQSGKCLAKQELINLSIFLLNLQLDNYHKQQAAEEIAHQIVQTLEKSTPDFSDTLFEVLSDFLNVQLDNKTKIVITLLQYFISILQKINDINLMLKISNFAFSLMECLQDDNHIKDIYKNTLEMIFKKQDLFSSSWICYQSFEIIRIIFQSIQNEQVKQDISIMVFDKIITFMNDLEDQSFHFEFFILKFIFNQIPNKALQQQYLKYIAQFQLQKYKSQKEQVNFYEIQSLILEMADKQEQLNILVDIIEHDIAFFKQNILNYFSEDTTQTIQKVDISDIDNTISHIAKLIIQMIYPNDKIFSEVFEQDIKYLLKSYKEHDDLVFKVSQIIKWMSENCFQKQTDHQIFQKKIQISLFRYIISISKDESAIVNNILEKLINVLQRETLDFNNENQILNNRISLIYNMIHNMLLDVGESIQLDEGIVTLYFNKSFQILVSQDIEVSRLIYEIASLIQNRMNHGQIVQQFLQNFFDFIVKQIQDKLGNQKVEDFYVETIENLIGLIDKKNQKEYFEKAIIFLIEQYQNVDNVNNVDDVDDQVGKRFNQIRDITLRYIQDVQEGDQNFLKQNLLDKWSPLIETDEALYTYKGLLIFRFMTRYLDKEQIQQLNMVNRLKTLLVADKSYLNEVGGYWFAIFLDGILYSFNRDDLKLSSQILLSYLQYLLETLNQQNQDQVIEQISFYTECIERYLDFTELCQIIQIGLKKIIPELSQETLKEKKTFQIIYELLKYSTLKLLKSGKQKSIGALVHANQILQANYNSIEYLKQMQPLLFIMILVEGQDHHNEIVKQIIYNYLNTDLNRLLDLDLSEFFELFSLILQYLPQSEQKSSLAEWLIRLLLQSMKEGKMKDRTFILKQMSIVFHLEQHYHQWFNISKQTICYLIDNIQEVDTLIKAIHIIFISQKSIRPEIQQQIMNLAFKSQQKQLIQKIEICYLNKIQQIKQNYIQIQNLLKFQEIQSYNEVTQEIQLFLQDWNNKQNIFKSFHFEKNEQRQYSDFTQKLQVLLHEQPIKYPNQNQIINRQHQGSGDGLKLLKVFDMLNQLCQFLLKQMDYVYKLHFNLSSYEFILVILNIISFENEETSDRKELIKECKGLLSTILKFMNQEGINWILSNISQISVLSHQSKMVVLKICDTIFEDGIISDNSDKKQGINEFRVLIEVIRSKANIILNDKNQLTVEGKTYNLNLSQNDWIIMDKEISLMIKDSDNPFIKQYTDYNPLFKNSSLFFQSPLDKKVCSIIDMDCINSKIEDVVIDSQWSLVELNAHNGDKIVYFEKRNLFGRRIVSLIDFENIQLQVKWIFDSNRMCIFGQQKGPKMFYAKITKKIYPKQSAERKEQQSFSNTEDKNIDWRQISKESEFIQCYNQFSQNKEFIKSSPTFVIYHDALLRLEVTSDRMQDIVYFEFMKTIKDQKESLKHELNALSIKPEEQQPLLEYYGGFVKTFNLCYTEASIIVSGKFDYDQGNKSITVLSKIASCLPFIGDIASSTIESVSEFINNIEIKRNANIILNFAIDHSDLSQQTSLISKQIIITNHSKLRENNFDVGYLDMFNAEQGNKNKKKAFFEKFTEKILGKLENLNQYIESNLYGNLYEGKYAQLGNRDASQFIEIYYKQKRENSTVILDKIYRDIQYNRKQINSTKIQKQPEEVYKGSCACSIF